MKQPEQHEDLVKGITAQLKPVFAKSEQAIYIYLDDVHKACNRKLAQLLGYKSAREWAKMEAPLSDVVEDDQQAVIAAYERASERMVASALEVRVRNIQTGETIKTRMIMAPVSFSGEIFVIHFLSPV